jgi:putative transposase
MCRVYKSLRQSPCSTGRLPRFYLYGGRCESSVSPRRRRFTKQEYQSLSHSRWAGKYHEVFNPKKRKKRVFGGLRPRLGEFFRKLATQKESKILEGHLIGDHVHICISIPLKFAVSNVVGFLKGKSAIAIVRNFGGRPRNFTTEVFWTRGFFVSTVWLDEAMVRACIRNQEDEDERYDQMKLGV